MRTSNLILCLAVLLTLTACKTKQEVKIEYRDRYVPVYVVPAPPEVKRPELLLNEKNKDTVSDEEFSRLYSATTAQLNGYIEVLEEVYNKYAELAALSAPNINKLDQALLTADKVEENDTREPSTNR
jgi:hypothetical protein